MMLRYSLKHVHVFQKSVLQGHRLAVISRSQHVYYTSHNRKNVSFDLTLEAPDHDNMNKKIEHVDSTSKSLFNDELFVPSSHLNTVLFEFKLKFQNFKNLHTEEEINKIISSMKEIICHFTKECGSVEKFNKIVYKVKPMIIDVLLKTNEISFVDFFTFIASKKIKIDNVEITEKFKQVLTSPTLSIRDKFKLLTCHSDLQHDTKSLNISILRTQLSKIQTNLLTDYYASDIIKTIITEVYLPLRDISKIDEYFNILSRQLGITDTKFKTFRTFVDFILLNHKLDFLIQARNSSIKYISNTLAETTKLNIDIPPSFSIDSWHEIFIIEYLSNTTAKTLSNYITTFYGKFPDELITLLEYSDIRPINPEILNELTPLLSEEKSIPVNIQGLFFDKLFAELGVEIIKPLIKDFEKRRKPELETLHSHFCFSILKYASNMSDRRQQAFDFLMQYLRNVDFKLPEFEKCNILSVYEYYKDDFKDFISYLNSINRDNRLYKSVDSNDVRQIMQNLDSFQKQKLFETLLERNFIFNDSSLIFSQLEENPKLINYVLSGGTLNSNTNVLIGNINTDLPLARLNTMLCPIDIFKMIADHGDKIVYSRNLLNIYKAYGNNFDYLCAKLRLLSLDKGRGVPYISILSRFFKQNRIEENLTSAERLKLYTIYIEKVIDINHFSGFILACTLIPSYKKHLLKLSGMTGSQFSNNSNPRDLLKIDDQFDVPISLIKNYVKNYTHSKGINGKLWTTMFKNVLSIGSEIKNDIERENFNRSMFKYFQMICVKNVFSPTTLYRIYQLANTFKLKPEWKLDIDVCKYLELYFMDNKKVENQNGISIAATFLLISKFESNLELPGTLISSLFDQVPDEEKMLFLVSLRNVALSIPYAENIHDFIRSKFKSDDSDIYKLFGLDIADPLVSSSVAKRTKWMRMDTRYFSPIIEIFMARVITKEQNLSIRQMIVDSIATMKCDANSQNCLNFYEVYSSVVSFENQPNTFYSQDLEKIIGEFNSCFKTYLTDGTLPWYLHKPFVFHFLYTRMYAYDLKRIIQLLYILTRGNSRLSEIGIWELNDENDIDILNKKSKTFAVAYKFNTDSDLLNIYRLIFTAGKNVNDISTNELVYIVKISENLLRCESFPKKSKYLIMNCTLILVSKHSDLLSAFYKKVKNLLPDYKITNTVITDLLYSTITNTSSDIDSLLDYMLGTNDTFTIHQSCEVVIKRLISENQNGLAQELYIKYIERRPKFRIQELNDSFSWGKAKQPMVTIDSNDGVNLKVDKYKVKLYDYELLDREKNG